MTTNGMVAQEVNLLQVIKKVARRNKSLQARLLQNIETHFDRNTDEYGNLRKFILDEINGYTRAILRDIFGDVEFLMK